MPLKHLSNFWRTLHIPLIKCEIFLTLTWCKNFALISKATIDEDYNAGSVVYKIDNPENATFQITDTRLYVPVVSLSEKNNKLLEQSRFKRTIKWNKYMSRMTVQTNNNNLNYLIDPSFSKVNRFFVLSFGRIEENNVKNIIEILFHIITYQMLK